MAHAPPGHHSVIGRPSVGGLHFPEYVVYRGEQVRFSSTISHCYSGPKLCLILSFCQAYPEYLITYQIVKPEENSGNEEPSRWFALRTVAANSTRNSMTVTDNRLENYFVITPAVSIDRNNENTRNRNNFTTTKTTTTALMTTTSTTDSNDARSWQWCSLWCSAIKCFSNVHSDRAGHTTVANTPLGTRVYRQNDNHFVRIDLPRKYRDKNCNITYELWRIQTKRRTNKTKVFGRTRILFHCFCLLISQS